MTVREQRIRTRRTFPIVLAALSFLACADNLDGPNECIFAYTVDPASVTVQVGDSAAIRAIPATNCGAPSSVTWRVDDVSKATVRSTGNLTAMVRGIAAGTTLVTSENGDKSGFAVVEVQ